MRARTFLLLTLIVVLFMPDALRGQVSDVYVDAVMGSDVMGDGTAGNPWQTITCGLSRATGPDVTLHVAPGTYNASLGEQFPLFLGDGVSLVGAGMGQTTIATTSTVVISGTAVSNLELSQLTVDGLEEAEIAVQLRSSAVSLNRVELTRLTKAGLWGTDDQGSSFHAGRITHIHAPDVDWHGVDGIAYGINLQGVTFSLADSRLDDLEGGSDPGWGWASGQAYGVKLTATSNVYLSNNQIGNRSPPPNTCMQCRWHAAQPSKSTHLSSGLLPVLFLTLHTFHSRVSIVSCIHRESIGHAVLSQCPWLAQT